MHKTFRLLLAAGVCLLALAGGRLTAFSAAAPALTWLETQYSFPRLEGATEVAFSPDMKFVYVAAFGDGAASVFPRNPQSGALIFVEAQVDGTGSVQDLNGAQGIVVSPDGAHVYVASYAEDALTIFSRNATSGGLTYLGRVKEGDPGISTLDGASGLAMDAAGEQLYVASHSDKSVTVFDRDPATGLLTLVDFEQDSVGGTLGLLGPERVIVSPDGKNVYVSSSTSDAIVVFSRDPSSGALTWLERMKDGVGVVDGLDGAFSLALDPSGVTLYATGTDESAIAIFTRNSSSGALTFSGVLKDGVDGVEWLVGARALLVNPAGNRLYLISRSDSALVLFNRDLISGALNYLSHLPATGAWLYSFKEPEALALSADGTSLYVASKNSNSLMLFACDPASGKANYSQVRSNIFDMRGPGGSAVSPNGERLYVTGNNDDTVLVFNRLPSGVLTFADSMYSRPGLDAPARCGSQPDRRICLRGSP